MALRYEPIARSAGNKKFVSATAVADYGDAQALWLPKSTPFRVRMAIGSADLHNRSGSTCKVGLAGRLPVNQWVAGQVTAAGVYTADTTDAQDEGTNDFSMLDRTDSGAGFLVGANIPFNALGIVQGVAGDQTATLVLEFWDGTAWTDMTAGLLISDALITGTGEKVLVWPIPSNWVVGGSGTGVPSTTYNVRVRHTVAAAGTTDPAASQMFVAHALVQLENVTDNQVATLLDSSEYTFPSQCDAMFPIFSTASFANTVLVTVRNG